MLANVHAMHPVTEVASQSDVVASTGKHTSHQHTICALSHLDGVGQIAVIFRSLPG